MNSSRNSGSIGRSAAAIADAANRIPGNSYDVTLKEESVYLTAGLERGQLRHRPEHLFLGPATLETELLSAGEVAGERVFRVVAGDTVALAGRTGRSAAGCSRSSPARVWPQRMHVTSAIRIPPKSGSRRAR